MKNRNLTLAILAMAVATLVSVAIVSCKKGSESTMSDDKTSAISASESNMDEYLISFKNKLLSAQKGKEAISIEQAERDLGNLLNFDFGDANYATDEWHRDTLFVPLAVSGEYIDLETVLNLQD